MSIQCGIVGLPNVGKSTLFNALTAAGIAAENYPFCTIDPNVGVVAVPDPRLHALAAIVRPQRVLPATVEFVDIAGLVEGAARGEGLGNQFLAHIRETHAIAQVVRCFDNDDVVHVRGRVDPLADVDTIHTELALADLETTERNLQRAERAAKSAQREAIAKHLFLARLYEHLAAGSPARTFAVSEVEQPWMHELHLLTAKPVMYVANTDEQGLTGGPYLDALDERASAEGALVVPVCAAIESEIARLEESERAEFLAELGLQEPGLHRVIRAAYRLLGLQTFYTAGEKEVRAWTCRTGATAPEAAGVIHTDFQRGFIRAEVIAYEDFVAHGGEHKAREAGRMRLEGKEYRVREGDVMHFRHNV